MSRSRAGCKEQLWGGAVPLSNAPGAARPVTPLWLRSWIAEKQKRHEELQRKQRKAAVKRDGAAQPEAPQGAAPQQGSAGPQTNITVDPLLS